jgi:hypothetical protein
MESLLRNWNCRGCGRANNTEIDPDGTVVCEYCADVKSIQPARNRGGETPRHFSSIPGGRPMSRRGTGNRLADPPSAESEDRRSDSGRRDAFLRLREAYGEAQKIVSANGAYAHLEWILGASRDATQNPPILGARVVELTALWLQDLAAEVDRLLPAGQEAARALRGATSGFLLAFRSDPAIPPGADQPAHVEEAVSR